MAGAVGEVEPSHEIACWRFFSKAERDQSPKRQPAIFCVFRLDARLRIHNLGLGKIPNLLMTSEPGRRRDLAAI
jgi:hypothetical protein